MKIAVTGCLGYIGSNICVQLMKDGYEVIGIDNAESTERLQDIEKLSNKKFLKFYNNNLADWIDNIDLTGVEIIFHFASYIAVEESVRHPISYYENNINATLNVCRLSEEFSINKIIYSSSATVYSTDMESPYKETDTLEGTTPYGRTKLFSEEVLKDFANTHEDMKIIIFRFFNPAGSDTSHILYDRTATHLFPSIKRYITEGIPLQLYGSDYPTRDGTCERDYIHILDLIDGHLLGIKAFDNLEEKVSIFNLGTGSSTSLKEIFEIMNNLSEGSLSYIFTSRREGDVPTLYANIDKARETLGFNPSRSILDICKSVVSEINLI